jgi:hypothetical protein
MPILTSIFMEIFNSIVGCFCISIIIRFSSQFAPESPDLSPRVRLFKITATRLGTLLSSRAQWHGGRPGGGSARRTKSTRGKESPRRATSRGETNLGGDLDVGGGTINKATPGCIMGAEINCASDISSVIRQGGSCSMGGEPRDTRHPEAGTVFLVCQIAMHDF